MDKKELLKRWALAYTEPSLFYVPWKKKHSTYTVEFRRYANIQFSKIVPPSSSRYMDYAYMISDEIYYSWLNAYYYIYDKNGNYYNSIGDKFKSEKPLNFQNTIKLPKGEYFYKEMTSLHGCKLIEGIIAFSVTDEHNTIVMHHQANLLSINYNIELEKIDFYESTSYIEETEAKRNLGYHHPSGDWYTAERIEDTQIIPWGINIKVPIIKVQNVSNYKNNYTNDVSLDIEFYDSGEIDEVISTKCDAEYILPRTPELWALTYKYQKTKSLSKHRMFYYNVKVNNTIYDDDKTNTIGSKRIKDMCVLYSNSGTYYNGYSNTTLTWYYNPEYGHVGNWLYEGYNAEISEMFGFRGRIGNSILTGKNTVLFSQDNITEYGKKTYISVSPETGEKTIEEKEYPSESLTTNVEVDNFNEMTIFQPLFVGIANNYQLGGICKSYLYKTKGSTLTCYGLGGSENLWEKRYLENGNEILNKDADSMYIGVLIQKEERQEKEDEITGGES